MINHYIDCNDDTIYSYLINIKHKLDKTMIDRIIDVKPESIIKTGIENKYIGEYNTYKIILLTESLDYFKLIDQFNVNIAINFIYDIVNKNLTKSFYFIYKIDNTIINILDDDGNTLIHKLTHSNDIVDIIIKLNTDILFNKNKDNFNPLMYFLSISNSHLVKKLIDLIIELKLTDIFDSVDNLENNIIHHLSSKNLFDNETTIKLIKNILKTNNNLLDQQNNKKLTPIMLCVQNKNEELFYLFKSLNCNMDIVDIYGNSIYHYICLNEIALNMNITNSKNYFGYTPSDYCKISKEYYYFT
jgi:hypothetical protein